MKASSSERIKSQLSKDKGAIDFEDGSIINKLLIVLD
jgi:hypothetical protein